ncbi:hypothetical protein P691DRAFT_808598 [Macrolepiota fuliginosa MF-IS2]|uniref:Uncharacterized protein n=1 Tax=Macrolepiota fuliginosa MF-IS2 TaxID=1400762 RepID=A0A9P5XMZ5_9AGAR|nr:hypothetical protein P691DRAFT_808598 [Macrolepiota fuliginosa MF-IS2]
MTPRNDHGFRHRKEVKRRQAARTTSAAVVPVRPTATPVRTTAVKPPLLTPIVKPTATRVITPVKPTVVPTLTSHATILPPSLISNTPTTTVPSVVAPPPVATSSLSVSTTLSALVTTTSTPLSSSIRPITLTSIVPLASSTPSSQPDSSSGVSTGAVVGGIIGGFVALGFIGAALFLFLRRTRERKEDHAEAFNAAKFRRSAILLEEPAEKYHKPRPPTMIEQHVRNSPAPQSRQYSPPRSAPYGDHAHYNASYTGASEAQAPYGQYPPLSNGYGYGDPHGYPPRPHYPPHSQYNTQQYSAYPPAPSPNSFASGQESLALPNPFDSAVETPVQAHYTHNTSSPTVARDLTQSISTGHDRVPVEDSDAPPAYEATSSSAGYKPDVKAKPSPSVMNPGESSNATASTPQASMPTVTSGSLSIPSSTPTTPSPTTTDRAHPSRRLSGTSAITTVYDPQDAYGGM